MADITISYKGNTIAEVSASGTTTLGTSGKYCEDNITLQYVRPSAPTQNDDSIYLFRALPYTSYLKQLQKIIGGTVAWNQYCDYNETTPTANWLLTNATLSISGRKMTITSASNSTARKGVTLKNFLSKANHKYLVSGYITPDASNNAVYGFYSSGVAVDRKIVPYADGKTDISTIFGISASGYDFEILTANATPSGSSCVAEDVMLIDLTQMFGSAIADYAYTLESNTAGSGIAWLKSYGFFTKPYYPYDAGSIVSVKTSASKMVGFNQWDEDWELGGINVSTGANVNSTNTIRSKNYIRVLPGTTYYNKAPMVLNTIAYDANKQYLRRVYPFANSTYTIPNDVHYLRFYYGNSSNPVTTYNNDVCINISDASLNGTYQPYCVGNYVLDSTIELRGLLKLDANNNLYYDGDEYTPDGTVKRKYEYRVYESGDESLADAITDGTHTVVKLSTQTTENATPYIEHQACFPNGTEQFVDGRTVEMPVEAVADYEVTS